MNQNVIARRYASALFQVAREKGELDQVAADFQVVSQFFASDANLADLLEHQRIAPRQKKEIVQSLWEKVVSATTMNFIDLMVDKHREPYLAEIGKVFMDLLRAERNVAVAEVKSAYPLDQDKELKVKQALEKRLGKQIELRVSVHPELLGGLVIRVGDRIFDGSATKRLQLMKERMADRSLGKLEVGM